MKIIQSSLLAIAALAQGAWAQSSLSVYGVHDATLLLDPICEACNALPLHLSGKMVIETAPVWARPQYDDGNRAYGVSLAAHAGPLTLHVAQQNKPAVSLDRTTLIAGPDNARNSILAVDVGILGARAYAALSVNRGTRNSPFWNPDNPYAASLPIASSSNSRDTLLGLAYPMGQVTLLAALVRKNDRDLANHDIDQRAVGASYALSHRTDIFAAWSSSTPRAGAGVDIAPYGGKMINIGMRHGF